MSALNDNRVNRSEGLSEAREFQPGSRLGNSNQERGSGTPTRSSATTTAFYISTLFLLNRLRTKNGCRSCAVVFYTSSSVSLLVLSSSFCTKPFILYKLLTVSWWGLNKTRRDGHIYPLLPSVELPFSSTRVFDSRATILSVQWVTHLTVHM